MDRVGRFKQAILKVYREYGLSIGIPEFGDLVIDHLDEINIQRLLAAEPFSPDLNREIPTLSQDSAYRPCCPICGWPLTAKEIQEGRDRHVHCRAVNRAR